MMAELDQNLAHFARIVERDLGTAIKDLPGAGAAGGLGGGLVAFASGKLEPGVSLVIEAVALEARLRGAELCLTGEGAIDASSAFGKTPVGVARLARAQGLPWWGPSALAPNRCTTRGSTRTSASVPVRSRSTRRGAESHLSWSR
jgi:glycerate kinase